MKKAPENENERSTTEQWAAFLERWHINPNLFMLKVTLFAMYGATASLLPYLTIHMQSIGLTVEEIAIVYLALPFTTFLSPPVTGYLVDKFGQYKPVVIFALILNAVCHHSLMLIPHMELPGETPPAYVMRHPQTERVEVWWSPCPSRECPDEEELDLVLASCLDHCQLRDVTTLAPHPELSTPQPVTPPECPCLKKVQNVSSPPEQGPTQKPLHFIMEVDGKKQKKKKHKRKQRPGDRVVRPLTVSIELEVFDDLKGPPEHLGIKVEPDDDNDTVDFRQSFSEKLLLAERVNVTALVEEDVRCGGMVLATNLTKNTIKELTADCILQKCSFRLGGPEVCPPDYKESDDRTFWIYFLLRFVGTTMLTAGVTMLDPIALTMIQKYGGEFGRERLFSSLGMAFFSPLTGLLIDQNSKHLGYTDYSAAFYTYDVLLLISAVTVAQLPLQAHIPADNIVRDLLRIVRLPHVILFIIFLFLLGNFWGFIESFLFLYLKELGASNYLLGITVTVGTISSMPFLFGADRIIKKVGHVNIIVIAFFSHAARLMGYSLIESPWWCFPFEAIESLAVHLMWIAAATYCVLLAPKTLLATLIGVLGMSHFSLGRGSGSFLGGFLIGTLGTRESFRFMGIMAIVGGIAYGALHYFWLRHVERRSENTSPAKTVTEATMDEPEAAEEGECTAVEDTAPSISMERLSFVIELNHRGSISSLDPGSRPEIASRIRRSSIVQPSECMAFPLRPNPGKKDYLSPVAALVLEDVVFRRDSIPEEDEARPLADEVETYRILAKRTEIIRKALRQIED
ncbi:major facilitator superfamily domain-containing protein 6-A [Anabrus simplex]|uniref:major facilitator superfamily domain-containing protein 6-A n=1 Tax=Anabrus simplex TaxID=316456 RepID=UPI0035A2EE1B